MVQDGGRTLAEQGKFVVQRVQTGVRMENRLLKVLKALAEYHDLTLGDLLEGIVLHAFDGKCPFQGASLKRIRELKKFYGLDLDSSASHRLTEVRLTEGEGSAEPERKGKNRK
jgi:hypothetical protein